ncbi:MAG: 2-C-methyl-D-erythritol 4-phosphate cytidylyltransferase [Planctomycetaceae bacterium]
MPRFAVILPAAGQGTRFSSQQNKTRIDLGGAPVWQRAAQHFVQRVDVAQVLLVLSPADRAGFEATHQATLRQLGIEVVTGGAERVDSVGNALRMVRDEADFVAVHDAARPLLRSEWIDRVFAAAVETGAAILATPITSTLKRADGAGQIAGTVSRVGLWAAQTPQVARTELLRDAYARRDDLASTDEAQLLEALGHPVRLVTGSPLNIKLTTPADWEFAQAVWESWSRERTC